MLFEILPPWHCLIHLGICYVQVTKLCDLGLDDSVCSVGWAQRGTHLAVGTSNGKVQVRLGVNIVFNFSDVSFF